MNIADEIRGALPGMRRHAVSLMTDVVRVERGGGEPDPLTGLPVLEVVYEGPGKVQSFRAYESSRELGGGTVTQGRREVHVPWDAGPFEIGDVVTVVESASSNLVGFRARVAFPDEKTHQTAQRLLVDQ